MSEHRPDYEALSGYLEGALSHDATRWVELHLQKCRACQEALEREREFLLRMDRLQGAIEPPSDFTEAVMARVAQQPAYQPPTEVPWRRVAGLSVGLAASLVVVLGIGGWMLLQTTDLGNADAGGFLASAIAGLAALGNFAIGVVGPLVSKAMAFGRALGTIVLQLFQLAREAGLAVQLAVLLVTVTLNYVFTRMVLNYQRRQ